MKSKLSFFKLRQGLIALCLVFVTAIISAFALSFYSGADYSAPEIAAFGDNGYTEKDIDSLISGIIGFKLNETGSGSVQEWIDGELSENAGMTSEWYTLALSQSGGSYDFSRYRASLERYINGRKIAGAVSRQKYALVLTAIGDSENEFVGSTLEDSIGAQGIMSCIFGLHLLNNGLESTKYTADELISELLAMRLPDGGWALSGKNSDTEVTSMAVQALSRYYNENIQETEINTETAENVKTAVGEAFRFLSEKQLDNGGFCAFGTENAESCAQIIMMLSSTGKRADDNDFIKNGNSVFDAMLSFRLPDGSFCHIKGGDGDSTATVQCLLALISMKEQLSGNGYIYDFNGKYRNEEAADAEGTSTVSSEDSSVLTASDETVPEANAATNGKSSYKLWVYLIISVLSAISCIILLAMKKRSAKNFIFVIVIAAMLALITSVTDFRTADEYYGGVPEKSNVIGKVTLSISCAEVANELDSEYVSQDGIILPETEFELSDGETVFDILVLAARKYAIQLENSGTAPGTNALVYVSGINYLYEMQFGDMSGWTYHVNGASPSVGCGNYRLSDGDKIEWIYVLGFDMPETVSDPE